MMSFSQQLNQLTRSHSNLKIHNYYTAKDFIKRECKSAAKRGYRELHIKWAELGVNNETHIMIQQLIAYLSTAKVNIKVGLLTDRNRRGVANESIGLSLSW